MRDKVIMSPLATCPISCAKTARTSRSSKRLSNPVLTATRALLRFHPVAKALAESDGKTPTSGMPIPASFAKDATVVSNHSSSLFWGDSMIRVPVPRLAMNFESSSDIREPLMPNRPQKTSKLLRFRSTPLLVRIPSRPRRLKMILTNTSTARFVARNRRILMFAAPRVCRCVRFNGGR